MLEFQEGFFEQEIRDGFYLDATMKTVWAAELEVLQKVAEVCDKYNLTWYAACGSLLGAIRHEGFVPWDDDMDIWLIRKDYNKLMEVLPKELPEHYRVRSPLTEEGYDQFHTCVNSGSGVSIAKEWLEQFQGCPFTVGLDIFPLDYLPRNEEEREMQKRLFLLVGRMAQQAKETDRGNLEVEDEDEVEDAIARSKADILEGIQYLEDNFNLKINKQLVEDELWYEASSELWKWANYIAMMYGEEDGDYLVEYVDYTRWENKKFPKEWFAEVYSATFENFMLPIPAGYHEVLATLYGEYMPYQRKTGQHEYPYYARQLRQLKEYVKDVQSRADKAGIANIEEIEVVEDSIEIPEEWLPIVTKKDGTRKKLILSANDPAVYMAYGDEALDKLENALAQFEQEQENVTLWWRPMPVMAKLLHTVSVSLAERYVSILNAYKNAGWGILDETDNADRAVASCDIYYGEMNAILQPFQNAGKPALIAHMGDVDYKQSNEARILEHKAFPNFTDFVEKDGKIYAANVNYNGIMILDKATGTLEQMIPFEGEDITTECMHYKCVLQNNRVCFLPVGDGCVHVYDIKNKAQKRVELSEIENLQKITWESYISDDKIYLLPCGIHQRLWSWQSEEDSFVLEEWWKIPAEGHHFKHGALDTEKFYSLHAGTDELFITDVKGKTVEKLRLPDDNVTRISYDGQNFWYVMRGNMSIVRWNPSSGETMRFAGLQADLGTSMVVSAYLGICCVEDKVFVVSQDGDNIYLVNQQEQELQLLYTREFADFNFRMWNKIPCFKQIGNLLSVFMERINQVVNIDLNTLRITDDLIKVNSCSEAEIYQTMAMLDRGALLYESSKYTNLNVLLQYCNMHS